MGMEQIDTKLQFCTQFPQAFLKLLSNSNGQRVNDVQTVQQLIAFAQNCFNDNQPVIKKFKILKDIISELNQQIQSFFRERKQKISDLSTQERKLQALEPKKNGISHIQQFIKLDKEQREMKKYNKKEEPTHVKEQFNEPNERDNSTKSLPRQQTQTVLTVANEKCPHCLCSKSLMNVSNIVQTNKSLIFRCKVCDNNFHANCMKFQKEINSQQFICPECVIFRLDPLHKIVEVLCEPVPFRPTQHAPTKTFTFNLGDKSTNISVEVRCIRIDGKNGAEEPTWPDIGDIQVNGKKMQDFKPLQSNSSLKKRKDEKFTTREMIFNASNVIQVREGVPTTDQKMNCRVSLGQTYFIGVFLVQLMAPEKYVEEVINNEETWMSMEQSKEAIQLYMKKCSGDEVEVESLTVSLNCFFDTMLIETPVRGNLCEHLQCLSLQNMSKIMQKVIPRRWRCPICKAKSFEFIVDSYQFLILKLIRDFNLSLEEISFNQNGEVEQEQVKSLLTQENIEKYLPAKGIKNQMKFLQLENLRKKMLGKKEVFDNEIITPTNQPSLETGDVIEVECYESKVSKKVCVNPVVTQQNKSNLSHAQAVLDRIVNGQHQEQQKSGNARNVVNPIQID